MRQCGMAGVNKVILIGSLGRDPELRYTKSGTAVCRLAIATDRQWTNKQTNERVEETEWHRVVVWNKQAELCNEHLAKGRQVYIEGRLKTTSYEDKDGKKCYTTDVIADVVQFLGGRPEGGGQSQEQSQPAAKPQEPGQYDPAAQEEDDIPF